MQTAPAAEFDHESTLTGLARGRFGRIDPTRIARHIVAVTPEADWAVRRGALDALARRYGFAQRDGLRVAERPEGVCGVYRTSAPGRGDARPYQTALLGTIPLRASCSCADFVRSSLGLCKHALTVVEALEKAGKLSRPYAFEVLSDRPRVTWSALVPLRGATDRLARLAYTHAGRSQPPPALQTPAPSDTLLADPGARYDYVVDLERRIARGTCQAEPAVSTLLAEEKVRAARILELGDAREPLKALSGLKRKLYPYQREGVARFFASGCLLLADDMGLGKTTQAIAACHGLFRSGRVRRGLLIAPSALKPQWLREWHATSGVPFALVEGSPEERARLYAQTKEGFLAVGYEQLLRDLAHVEAFAPELVVLDEAQRIKNWATKSAAYVKALKPAYRLVLTGTPMENRFEELASIMDFVDDLALEPKWRLVPLHQVAGEGGKGIAGARNLDVLRARLAPAMLRRLRSDVLSQLPPRTDTRVPVEMTEAQRERHDDLLQPIAELVARSGTRALGQAEFLKLMQLLTTQRMLCNGLAQVNFESEWPRLEHAAPTPSLLDGLFAPKLTVLRGLLEQLAVDQKRKVVVFSQWRAMLRLSEWAVRDVLAAAGLRAVFFTGAESTRERERAIAAFHDDPAVAVMFLSDAGGVGLNLQRAASACVNLELPWNPAVLEQRIGRIYRLGQSLPIDVYNLVTEDGIEARIARLLGQKKAVFSALFDGASEEVRFDGEASFMEGVRKLVEPLPPVAPPPLEVSEEEGAGEPELLVARAPESLVARERESLPACEPEPLVAREPALLPPPALKVERLANGALRIEAPPELAEPLAALLESLAKTLRASLVEQPAHEPRAEA